MPNLNEFLNNNKVGIDSDIWENIDGIRPCSKCEEDVNGALWDPHNLILKWVCNTGHENLFKVN